MSKLSSIPPRLLIFSSMGLYIACLPFDAICIGGRCSAWPAWSILLFGVFGLPLSAANLTWLANPLLFLGGIGGICRLRPMSVWCSAAALLVGGSFDLASSVVNNEGFTAVPISGVAMGYWLWLASMAAVLAGCLALPVDRSKLPFDTGPRHSFDEIDAL